MAVDTVFPLLVAAAVLSRTAPRSVRASSVGDPATLIVDSEHPGRAAWPESEAQWDPGPERRSAREHPEAVELTAADGEADVRLAAGGPDGEEGGATQEPTAATADTAGTVEQDVAADPATPATPSPGPGAEDVGDQQQAEQRSGPVTAGAEDVAEDAEAMPSEVLPMPAPLSMGRGPPMTLSLEDMDYLTILRPPQAPQAGKEAAGGKGGPARKGAAAAKNKRKVNGGTKANKSNKLPTPAKAPGKGRPKAPPPRPPPPPPPQGGPLAGPPSSYSPFDAAHPYGYGYGYYDYPRYRDPVMSHEYQTAASYPEEERFRPVGPPMMGAPHGGSHGGPMGRPPGLPPPHVPMGTPLAPSPPPPPPATAGYDPYLGYRHRDFPPQDPRDQRPSGSGAVQVTQSVSAGEHHSSHDAAAWLSSLPPSTAASTLSTTPSTASSSPDLTAATAAPARKATLKDILLQDCPGAEELGYCDSPPRYPIQQVLEAIQRCSELMAHMYAPAPEDPDAEPAADTEGEGACQSVRRVLRPGYVRDASSGRWLVALQSRGGGGGGGADAAPSGAAGDRGALVVQRVPVERCSGPGRPCARLADSKCARNLGFRNGARSTACEQRTALVAVLTWDPEAPADCPRARMVRFPVACVCKMV